MEKRKAWQLYLIFGVMALTLYNILPTIFYYSHPLSAKIDAKRAGHIVEEMSARVNDLEEDSVQWISSFSNLIHVKPSSIALNRSNPEQITVTFEDHASKERFAALLPRAGAMIPFLPAQLFISAQEAIDKESDENSVIVERKIPLHLEPTPYFSFIAKKSDDGRYNPKYFEMVGNRALNLLDNLDTKAPLLAETSAFVESKSHEEALAYVDQLLFLQQNLAKYPALEKRFWSSFLNGAPAKASLFAKVSAKLSSLQGKATGASAKNIETLLSFLKSREKEIVESPAPSKAQIVAVASQHIQTAITNQENLELISIPLQGAHLFFEKISIDLSSDRIILTPYPDLLALQGKKGISESASHFVEKINLMLYNSLGETSRASLEELNPYGTEWQIALSPLQNSTGFIAFDLSTAGIKKAETVASRLVQFWNPKTTDFAKRNYPIRLQSQYLLEPAVLQKVGLVVFPPIFSADLLPKGFQKGALYVIVKNAKWIQEKNREAGTSSTVASDLDQLGQLLEQLGFRNLEGASHSVDKAYAQDLIFELTDFAAPLLKATRENFQWKGQHPFALLAVSDVEERILTWNRIEDQIQEDLLKWRDEYNQAQVDLNETNRNLIPKPTRNPFWANLSLSTKKYFRGDERKILKWGLDLSGGKMVRIALVDKNHAHVVDPADLNQALNELYTRVNKMGVQERSVRIENSNIILEFPGSQSVSAKELIQASAMYFHVVNEKFGPYNESLRTAVHQFLQEVWNEAVVTGKTSIEEIQKIAWNHLGQGKSEEGATYAISESAKRLQESGLVLADPHHIDLSSQLNEEISTIARFREGSIEELTYLSHPLVIVFNNYALAGSDLNNIHPGYSPQEGNHLTFSVKNHYEDSSQAGSPRDALYSWTSQFAEDKIQGTDRERLTQGRGWRMGVILNGEIISMPSLKAALRDSASISGRFTQREVTQLAADLKAGSLSFTPQILSEENISAELGLEERLRGIGASILSAILVAVAMIGYYRFAGLIATIAVFINILIMWGVLQNLQAALTLPGIAGIVLTIGMAVDANVLVFERIREEFAISGRIASAIQAGYKKAFSAIVDSNITTIIAAFILIQFDSGPIKGFAITLIIGIFSSMFTALFMTKTFFQGWVQNPKNKSLTFSHWINATHFDFLSKARAAFLLSSIAIILGGVAFWQESGTLFGMDFRGGWSLVVEVASNHENEISPRTAAIHALKKAGAKEGDFDIRELNSANQLQIGLSRSMAEKGHPFASLTSDATGGSQEDPKLLWTLSALRDGGLAPMAKEGENSSLLDSGYQWSSVSGQFSETMAKNGAFGLIIAFLAILLYIALRFEFFFAVSAVVGVVHDVLITLGLIALFHGLGWNVQIDLETLGAIMTIIGYSLNDTIIVFDRIREDMKLMRKQSLYEIINHALNITLSRTLMTSGTTLLVLLSLVLFGGSSIFGFALVMTIGVIVGTLSSLFIASPLLLWLEERKKARANG